MSKKENLYLILEELKTEILKFLNKNDEKALYDFFYEYLKNFPYEGIIIYKNKTSVAKIRKSDYNLDIKKYNIPLENKKDRKEEISLSL